MRSLRTICAAMVVIMAACEPDTDADANRAAATRSFVTDTNAVTAPTPAPVDSSVRTPAPDSQKSGRRKRRGRRSVIRYPDGGFCVTEVNGDFYCSDAAGQDQAWGGPNGGGSNYYGESRGAPRP